MCLQPSNKTQDHRQFVCWDSPVLARLGKRPDMENGLCDLAAGSNGITDCTCIAQFSAASIKKATLLSSSIGPLLCIESRHWWGLGCPDWPVWKGCVSQKLQGGVGERVSCTGGAVHVSGQCCSAERQLVALSSQLLTWSSYAVCVTSGRLCKLVQLRAEFFWG